MKSPTYRELKPTCAFATWGNRPYALDVTIEYFRLFPNNMAILSGKNIVRFYTISETQAARNLYFQYVNYNELTL